MHGYPERKLYFEDNKVSRFTHYYNGQAKLNRRNPYHRSMLSTSLRQQYKKSRDTARMTAFLNRKDAENLPFSQVDNMAIQNFCFNSLMRNNITQLQAKLSDTFAEVATLQKETRSFQEKLKSLDKHEKFLQRKTDVQTKLISTLREQLKELETQTETLKEKNLQYSDQYSVHQETLGTSKRVIGALNIQNNYLENIAYQQCNSVIEGLENIIWSAEKEFKILSTEILKLKYPEERSVLLYACKSCMSNTYHKKHECPALDAKCELCDESGHFTITCDEKQEFILSKFVVKHGPYGL